MTEGAFKLRRELTLKAPALKAAIRAEGVVFRLKRELQRLDLENPNKPQGVRRCPRCAAAASWSRWTGSGYRPDCCRVEGRRIAGRGSVAHPVLSQPGRSPIPMGTFPPPALRTRRADFRHRALQCPVAANGSQGDFESWKAARQNSVGIEVRGSYLRRTPGPVCAGA